MSRKTDRKKDLPKASLLALLLNIEEDRVLTEIVRFEELQYHRTVDVLAFDGCQIRKTDDVLPLTSEELVECSEWVHQQTGYSITLIEKPMTHLVDLTEKAGSFSPLLLHLLCHTEYEAAMALKDLHGTDLFKYCDEALYVYDKRSGLWNCDEKTVHQQMIRDYLVEMGPWLETVSHWTKLYTMLQTQSVDAMFLNRVQLSSLGKVLFRNGYYDFETHIFSTTFSHHLFFPFRIERHYNEVKTEEHIAQVNKILFIEPFESVAVGDFIKQSLARALAGCIRDKRIYFNIGPPNAGKGVLTDALTACGERYVSTFNGGVLQVQGDKDCSLRNKELLEKRWCRVLLSNEMPMTKPIDGVFLKVISSGGDQMTGRILYGNNADFIPHSTTFVNGNDRPKIVPADEATQFRVLYTAFTKTFVLDGTENGVDRLKADVNIKETLREPWFMDALFHVLSDAYSPMKSVAPEEVRQYSNVWSDSEDFLANFLQHYQVTELEQDSVSDRPTRKL